MELDPLDRAPVVEAPILKRCAICKVEKPRADFYIYKSGRPHSYCRSCNSTRHKTRKLNLTADQKNVMRQRQLEWNRRDYKERPEKTFSRSLVTRYHMTVEQYRGLSITQDGLCAICHKPETQKTNGAIHRLSIDHDHTCCPEKMRSCGKCVRGLLCGSCNRALGLFQDDEARLMEALAYLRKWRR